MKDGFGLKFLYKYLNVPFLIQQVSPLFLVVLLLIFCLSLVARSLAATDRRQRS